MTNAKSLSKSEQREEKMTVSIYKKYSKLLDQCFCLHKYYLILLSCVDILFIFLSLAHSFSKAALPCGGGCLATRFTISRTMYVK